MSNYVVLPDVTRTETTHTASTVVLCGTPDLLRQAHSPLTGNQVTLLTGAAGAGGFKGLGGRFGRRQLLSFGVAGVAGIRLTRRDTGRNADCVVQLQRVPGDPRLGELLPAVIQGIATPQQASLFAELWQDRLRRILVDHAEHPELVEIRLA